MQIQQLLPVMVIAFAGVSAQATVTQSTSGSTTTYVENFNGGTSFDTGYKDAFQSTDDYLHYANGIIGNAQSSSLSFATVARQNFVTVSFYYAFWNPNSRDTTPASISLDGRALNIGSAATGIFLDAKNNNPGADSDTAVARADRFGSFSWSNVDIKNDHKLTFNTGAGSMRELSVDDLTITVSAVPEPETYAMLLAGLGLIGSIARRRKQTNAMI